jgi:hypothetical protein
MLYLYTNVYTFGYGRQKTARRVVSMRRAGVLSGFL